MLLKISNANDNIGTNTDVETPASVFLNGHFCKQLLKLAACHLFSVFAFYPIFYNIRDNKKCPTESHVSLLNIYHYAYLKKKN